MRVRVDGIEITIARFPTKTKIRLWLGYKLNIRKWQDPALTSVVIALKRLRARGEDETDVIKEWKRQLKELGYFYFSE